MLNNKIKFLGLLILVISLVITMVGCDAGNGVVDDVVDETLEITGVEEIPDKTVEFGTDFENINLPEEIEVTLSDNSTTILDVNWLEGNYDGETAGTYTIVGDLDLTDEIINPDDLYPSVKVTVQEEGITLYTVSVDYDDDKGTVAGDGVYEEGEEVELTATAKEGYVFKEWTGHLESTDNTITFDMPAEDVELTAVFEDKEIDPEEYELTINIEGEGNTIPEEGTHEYEEGTTVNLKAIPEEGWEFDHWVGNVQESSTAETSILIESDEAVTAVFEKLPETKIYEGSGDDVIDIERPDNQETFLIYIEGNEEERYFGVQGKDITGENTNLYVNTTEYYEGLNLSTTDDIFQPNPTEQLEISAETGDSWYIEVRPINKVTEIEPTGSYSNEGDYVFKIDSAISLVTIEGNESERYFGVKSHDFHFEERDLLVNTTNYYYGTVSIEGNMRYFEVNAATGDNWRFDF